MPQPEHSPATDYDAVAGTVAPISADEAPPFTPHSSTSPIPAPEPCSSTSSKTQSGPVRRPNNATSAPRSS